ncbi:MAG: stage II sporulation protein M [Nanoarchaeota archaeon]|nr:stage II sporulation protein M [Nanoarchaeota archaeon]MBU4124457.1 stage II sporulation protein M [Nanoarchaeota archaeon]
MLDVILREELVEKRPSYAFALGILFSTIGIAVSILMFKDSPSFPAVFLTTLAAAPIAMRMRKKEEKTTNLIKRYEYMIGIYAYLFFGMAVSFALWFAILPAGFVEIIFKEQLLKFTVGYFTFATPDFISITINNIGLMLFFFLLSLFYGSGSMFLLAWNASVLGVMWGNTIRGLASVIGPIGVITNTLKAFPYLFPEVIAYFLAAVAGLMLSFAFTRKKDFDQTLRDALKVLAVAIILILVSGVIETIILGF